MKADASSTAEESLLRTLVDEAEWEHRVASRVRSFATTVPEDTRRLTLVR